MSPTPPTAYAVPVESSSPKFASAWAAGCGGHATNENYFVDDRPVALFGSPARAALLDEAWKTRDVYYADHAYFRRGKQFRIARNRYQSFIDVDAVAREHAARAAVVFPQPLAPPKRFAALNVTVAPTWNREGTSILICPNSPIYMAQFGLDAKQWALDTAIEVSRYSDRPIVIRWKAQQYKRPFYMDVHDAWATVVFTSGAAVESLVHGVPIFVTAGWATSYPMGLPDLTKIETPYYPDHREPFLWSLAERQWSLDEIRAGVAWRWFCAHPGAQ